MSFSAITIRYSLILSYYVSLVSILFLLLFYCSYFGNLHGLLLQVLFVLVPTSSPVHTANTTDVNVDMYLLHVSVYHDQIVNKPKTAKYIVRTVAPCGVS